MVPWELAEGFQAPGDQPLAAGDQRAEKRPNADDLQVADLRDTLSRPLREKLILGGRRAEITGPR